MTNNLNEKLNELHEKEKKGRVEIYRSENIVINVDKKLQVRAERERLRKELC